MMKVGLSTKSCLTAFIRECNTWYWYSKSVHLSVGVTNHCTGPKQVLPRFIVADLTISNTNRYSNANVYYLSATLCIWAFFNNRYAYCHWHTPWECLLFRIFSYYPKSGSFLITFVEHRLGHSHCLSLAGERILLVESNSSVSTLSHFNFWLSLLLRLSLS